MDRKFFNGMLAGAIGALMIVMVTFGVLSLFGRVSIVNTARQSSNAGAVLPDDGSSAATSVTATSEKFNKKVAEIFNLIDYYYYTDIDHEVLEEGMLDGIAASLGDEYAEYYSKTEFADIMQEDSGSYCGMGAIVSQNYSTGIITIVKPYPDSPAFKAGALPGDIIVKVDGEDVTGMNLTNVVSKVKGEVGTEVVLTIYREGERDYRDLHITRAEIHPTYVEHKMLENDIGYIYVSEYIETTLPQFEESLNDLKDKGMKSLIIDLRDNPGGLVDICVDMLDLIVEKDQLLVYTTDKWNYSEEYYSRKDTHLDIPIVVLVNNSSASCAEIFTGCLQTLGKATVIGEKTFGKGIVQYTFPIGDGDEGFKFTSSNYYLPDGSCIHEIGIEPDIEVILDEEYARTLLELRETDNQLEAAIDYLK